jgi:tRNA dimethylallyltransferase
MPVNKPSVGLAVCLMGPTASGKTGLAIELCNHYPFELISVDSALIYRGMDIGTAKPEPDLLARYPHHLIDIRDPAETYSVSEFTADAQLLMHEIAARNRIPLLVGGSMLYFRALRDGLADLPPADADIRRRISEFAGAQGWEAVHRELTAVDPASAKRIHPNDPQRLQRALEVYKVTGQTMTELHDRQTKSPSMPFRFCQIALLPLQRVVLHERIAQRFSRMLDAGLVDEVRQLYDRGDLSPSLPAIRAVGYRQIWRYLDGEISYEEMVETAVVATRQLAKRQLTWLRSWPDLHKLDSDDGNLPERTLKIVERVTI